MAVCCCWLCPQPCERRWECDRWHPRDCRAVARTLQYSRPLGTCKPCRLPRCCPARSALSCEDLNLNPVMAAFPTNAQPASQSRGSHKGALPQSDGLSVLQARLPKPPLLWNQGHIQKKDRMDPSRRQLCLACRQFGLSTTREFLSRQDTAWKIPSPAVSPALLPSHPVRSSSWQLSPAL